MSQKPEIKIFPTVDALNRFAAERFVNLSVETINERGIFTVALSGGSTPKGLYTLLADENEPFREKIDWTKTHFFWGDERCVAPDAPESNFKMAFDAMLSKVESPPENIHRFPTEKSDPQLFADEMESELRHFFQVEKGGFPAFDLILLGLGADGHTASLFPSTSALNETNRLVVANYVEKFQTFRLTLTANLINHSRQIIFLVAGADKAEALREVLQGKFQPEKYPAQLIQPISGKILFLADEKSAV
jgi:6-phosphogluconolactonase